MKKNVLLVATAICLLSVGFVSAAKDENGVPFQRLWHAIVSLENRVDNIELIPGLEGPAGQNGDDGLSCWDLDQDGTFDPEEDTDKNGKPSVDDCRVESSGSLIDFDALNGLTCNLGSLHEGTINISYSNTGEVNILCDPILKYSLGLAIIGLGSITSQDPVIDCMSSFNGEYAADTSIVLAAAADSGYYFQEWTGDCAGFSRDKNCTLLMDSDKTAGALMLESHVLHLEFYTQQDSYGCGMIIPAPCFDGTHLSAEITATLSDGATEIYHYSFYISEGEDRILNINLPHGAIAEVYTDGTYGTSSETYIMNQDRSN